MPVSAKFVVNRISEMGWATEIEMVPDYAHGRNKEWAAATPAGMIRMTVRNTVAVDQFRTVSRDVSEKEKSGFADKDSIDGKTTTGRPKVVLFFDEDDPVLAQLGI